MATAWKAGKPLSIEEVEVRVKILYTSLCSHTDVYFWEAKVSTHPSPRSLVSRYDAPTRG
ncbi:hypothetical protein HU200_033705 [Digitaria exilis]|uniref:Uncharacterized protein n=1 Tax=Digitaria exilis TaxID=1010633 RepID=A0A835BUV4_9POAL|nr:hypothetical protein HU200_033705 [Digitaria exilis]